MSKSLQYIYSVLSGLLFGLAWNSFIPAFSLFIAFIPFLFILQNVKLHYTQVFNLSFLTFIIYHLVTVWWIYQSSILGFLVVIMLNSLFMSIVMVLSYINWQKFGFKMGILSLVLYWLSFEYLHYRWEISWPFMNLGNWLGQIPKIVQWYEYTGVLGGTLWILFVNIILYIFIRNLVSGNMRFSIFAFIAFIIIFIAPIIISKSIYKAIVDEGEEYKIKIIQPNINPYTEKYNAKLFDQQIQGQINLAKKEDSVHFDCFLFPESSFPVYLNEQAILKDSFLKTIDSQLVVNGEKSVIGGLYSYQVIDKDTLFYNTAFMLGSDFQIYHKSKLVVGVEKMPFQDYLDFLKQLNFNFGGYSSSLSIDNQRKVFYTKDSAHCIAPIICYESVYGQFVSEFINEGSTSIAVITNDGWWGDTPALMQILMHSQLRAIETRKSIARAANTGVSCFIDQKGEIVSQTEVWAQNSLVGSVFQNNKRTFYTRKGDYIGKISVYNALLVLLFYIYIRIKPKTKLKIPVI